MYKSLSAYIQQCDDDLLYELFEYVVEEMNRRKAKEKVLSREIPQMEESGQGGYETRHGNQSFVEQPFGKERSHASDVHRRFDRNHRHCARSFAL